MNFEKEDKLRTLENKKSLIKNRNLLYWYEKLYEVQFASLGDLKECHILEIGSGTSPLKRFYPSVITSDILDLDYLDYRFDCHRIDEVQEIQNDTLDAITMTNVLHHLKMPLRFLKKAALKLRPGGRLLLAEPYLSTLSRFIYKRIHYEGYSLMVEKPVISQIDGPLRTANSALPYLIFFSDRGWDGELKMLYDFDCRRARPYTSLSYFITGGISHRLPVPHRLYRFLYRVDNWLARQYPNTVSSFFILEMIRK